ncbi:MAG: RpiB/LacA/LacB family sugar-phosphate isomerase, partial [Desulfamplus sp.]|nr:RpiB/LacA/LacB family sugar-phosphate isomerase [Desulfamplus sp.]
MKSSIKASAWSRHTPVSTSMPWSLKKAILLCGTGLGMSIAANRFPNVRAALCNDIFLARMSREHN